MPISSGHPRQQVAVFGAAGRVGRAVAAALLRDGQEVTALLRGSSQHELSPHPGLRVVRGDAQHPGPLAPMLGAVDAVVLAVTPFTAPPDSFDDFDVDYYATIVTGIDDNWHRPRKRLIAVGLTATLELDSGTTVTDDPAVFPPQLRPFAEAHRRELSALQGTATLDWAILTPPAGFGTQREPTTEQGYQLIVEPVTRQQATAQLTHADYAQAVTAEITNPTVHRTRVAVIGRQHP